MCSPREAKACDVCIGNDRSMKKTDSQWVRLLYGGAGAGSSKLEWSLVLLRGKGRCADFCKKYKVRLGRLWYNDNGGYNLRKKKGRIIMSNNSASLKVLGGIMVVFGFVYAIVGTLALVGSLQGALPGHEAGEALVVVLAYVVAVLGIVCGVACIKGNNGTARTLGLVFGVVGLVALIYAQLTQGTFNSFDCVAMVFGIAIYSLAK